MKLEIAGIPVRIVSKGYNWELPYAYRIFVTPSKKSPAQVLNIHSGNLPSLPSGRMVFKAGNSWTLYADEEGLFIFEILDSVRGGYTRRLALFTPDFASAEVYAQLNSRHSLNPTDSFPLEHPLHKLAMINLLAQGYGVMLHAAAIIEGGEAIVFTGPSGAGKSTLACLYSRRNGITVLNDDAIVIRKIGGQYWAFGTPWCGSRSTCSSLGAPIGRIYAIEHAAENIVRPIRMLDAVAMLFGRVFIPFYRPESVEFILDFVADLGRCIPCHRLGFMPDANAVSFVRQMERG